MSFLAPLVLVGTGLAIALFAPEIVDVRFSETATTDTKAIAELIFAGTGIVMISLGVVCFWISAKLDELKKK